MTLYRPSELLAFLRKENVLPKKGLSQNFLIDGNILKKIISIAGVKEGDHIIEIGPGPGALTAALLQCGADVLALEKDPIFAQNLQRLDTSGKRLTVIKGDALDFPYENFLKRGKVVSNLPYHITTPLLTRILPLHHTLESVTVMVQKEVGQRICAQKNSCDFSSFSLFAAVFSAPHYAFTVKPTSFYPRPSVDSAVVHFTLKAPPEDISSLERFFQFTRSAFQMRRKMLRTSLKDKYGSESIEEGLIAIGLKPTCRPQELSLEEFISLFLILEAAKSNPLSEIKSNAHLLKKTDLSSTSHPKQR